MKLSERAHLAQETLAMKATRGIPAKGLYLMDVPLIEELAGAAPGEYEAHPRDVYLRMQRNVGTSLIDQFIPENPLTMTQDGYDASTRRSPTTGLAHIARDGMEIDSPEAVVEHLETFVFPATEQFLLNGEPEALAGAERTMKRNIDTQAEFGSDILKAPYGGIRFPSLRYYQYGYENYFMAYALYPDVMERDFSLEGAAGEIWNRAYANALAASDFPQVHRVDHDMADGRGTLVDIKSLDRIWFPHFARAMQPLLDAGIRLIWHCDGNLMAMAPRLIEVGFGGFQGFQYEHGMDYEAICRMTDRNGDPLMIWAGVSVTTTLPDGATSDVTKELRWLVENGPPVGLVLGGSSSITPATNHDNIKTLIEGLAYYREHGRHGL